MFAFLIQTSLRQRMIVLGVSLLLVVYGVLTVRQMPVDVFPDLNKPTVTLMTEAGGMAPEEVEQLVTFPIESGMNGMPGVTRVRSGPGVGRSLVYVAFERGRALATNRQQLAARIRPFILRRRKQDVASELPPRTEVIKRVQLQGQQRELYESVRVAADV